MSRFIGLLICLLIIIGAISHVGYNIYNENFRYYIFWNAFLHNSFFSSTGMTPFAPATVAGYAGDYQPPAYDKAWFNPNNIVARYNTILSFIGQDYNDNFGNGKCISSKLF